MPLKVGDRGLYLTGENIRSMTPWYYNQEVQIIRISENRFREPILVVQVLSTGDNVVIKEGDLSPFEIVGEGSS